MLNTKCSPGRLFIDVNGKNEFIGYADSVDIAPVEEVYTVSSDCTGSIPEKEVRIRKCVDYTFHLTKRAKKNADAPMATSEDMVNHPPHYEREDAMESIDEMVLVFGKEMVRAFCLCNVWKYRYRAGNKNGSEDMKKSDWYMRKYKELGGGSVWSGRVL